MTMVKIRMRRASDAAASPKPVAGLASAERALLLAGALARNA
jgi:hypothetical protein